MRPDMTCGSSQGSVLVVNPAIQTVELDDVNVQLFGINGALTIADQSRHIRDVLAWCGNGRAETEIRTHVSSRLPQGEQLVDFLLARDILIEHHDTGDMFVDYLRAAAQPTRYLRDDRRSAKSLRDVAICLDGSGLLAEACREALPPLGPTLVDGAGDADLILAVSDALDHDRMRDRNPDAILVPGLHPLSCGVRFGCLDPRRLDRVAEVWTLPGRPAPNLDPHPFP